jgi:hypothetical protein
MKSKQQKFTFTKKEKIDNPCLSTISTICICLQLIFTKIVKLQLRAHGVVCRESTNECDLPEVCSGDTGQCPPDVYKKNGNPCSNNAGYCFNGVCPALDLQCEQVWGYGGIAADKQCFEQFNSKGSINGHCGTDTSGHFIKCEAE